MIYLAYTIKSKNINKQFDPFYQWCHIKYKIYATIYSSLNVAYNTNCIIPTQQKHKFKGISLNNAALVHVQNKNSVLQQLDHTHLESYDKNSLDIGRFGCVAKLIVASLSGPHPAPFLAFTV